MHALHTPAEPTPVDAYCSTGSSPGSAASFVIPLLDLDHGGATRIPVRFEFQGPPGGEAVVLLGGISAGRHPCAGPVDPSPGWWPGVAGPGLALDPLRHRLIGIDWVGGAGGEWPRRLPVTTHDQARAVAAVLDRLEIACATLVGASYGGMVALAFAELFPERVRRSVVLCAAHRPHPMATAVRWVQREILRFGVGTPREAEAVALARALAMTTYRSAVEFEERFEAHAPDPSTGETTFPVEAYLRSRGTAFAGRFDAEAFHRLSESIDLHRVDPGRVVAPTLLVSAETDTLSPPWLVEELARAAPGVTRHRRLSSGFGHDAFLKEPRAVQAVLRDALGEGGEVDR